MTSLINRLMSENKHVMKAWRSKNASFPTKPETINFVAWTGNLKGMEVIKQEDAHCEQDEHGWTALHQAVWNMHHDVIKTLLHNPMTNVRAKNEEGWTALHLGVWNNDRVTIEMLSAAGAFSSDSDHNGWTPIHWAAQQCEDNDVIEMLANMRNNAFILDTFGKSVVHIAVEYANPKIIETLAKFGVDLDGRTFRGETPLHLAAKYGRASMVQALTKAGADLSARDRLKWWTPLHFAVSDGNIHTIEALIDAGAYVSARDIDGWTPVHIAAARGRSSAILLLSRHCYVEVRNNDSLTPSDVWKLRHHDPYPEKMASHFLPISESGVWHLCLDCEHFVRSGYKCDHCGKQN